MEILYLLVGLIVALLLLRTDFRDVLDAFIDVDRRMSEHRDEEDEDDESEV